MINFEYKGFLGTYQIKKLTNNLYSANGNVRKKNDSDSQAKKFYTENLNEQATQKDILNQMERYVDFEIQQAEIRN